MCVRVCVCMCMCMYVCMYVCMYGWMMDVCIGGCMCMYMCIYIYIYIYIYHTILAKKVQFIQMRTQSSVHYDLRQPIETTDGRTYADKKKERLLNELIDRPKCRQWTDCWMYRHSDRKRNIYRLT